MPLTEAGAAVAAAGISAAAGVGSGIISSGRGRKSQKRALRYNKELAQYQYELNLDAWNRQNAYNSPKAQMERYREAGLNPYLALGEGNPGNASQVPQYEAPSYQENATQSSDLGVGSAVDKGLQAFMAMAQFEETKKNNEVQRAKIEVETLNDTLANLQGLRKYSRDSWEDREAYRLGMSQAAVQFQNLLKTQQDIAESKSRVLNLGQEYALREVMNPIQVQMAKLNLERLQMDNDFKRFEYSVRKQMKILPGMTSYDRLISIGLDMLEGKNTPLDPVVDKWFGKKGKESNKSLGFWDVITFQHPFISWLKDKF